MNFVPIRLATLRPEIELGFNVYIRISEKHILYIRSEDFIEKERLDHLHDKSVRQLWISYEDEPAYKKFLESSREMALKDPNIALGKKAAIISGQAKAAVEDIFEEPTKKENYEALQGAARDQVQFLESNPEALEHVMKVAREDHSIYQHCVNVSTLSIGLVKHLGAPETVAHTVGTGALMHDVGRTSEITKDKEPDKYFQHPRLGAGILAGKKYISRDVLDIILLHEERLDGKGYPAGVKKLDQIFQVVGLTNMFDRMVTFEGASPQQAYEMIIQMKPLPYDEDLIEGLKTVLVANKIY